MRAFLAIVLFSVMSTAWADTMNARAFGRGDTGIVIAGYQGALDNPALVNRFRDADSFAFNLNAGAFAADPDNMQDDIDFIGDRFEDLESGQNVQQNAGELQARLATMDGKGLQAAVGGSLLIAIPNNFMAAALVAKNHSRLALAFAFDPDDAAYLSSLAGPTPPPYSESAFKSTMGGSGVSISEIGLTLGRTIESRGVLGTHEFGATIKAQQIDLVEYDMNIATFETSDFRDDENRERHQDFNIDVGFNKYFADWYGVGLRVKNLIPETYTGPGGTEYQVAPQAVLGVGVDLGWLKGELNADVNEREGFGHVGAVQYIKAGVEVDAWRNAQLRFGYRHDLNDEIEPMATFGLGLSPFNVVNLDIAALKGAGDSYGALLQLGLRF